VGQWQEVKNPARAATSALCAYAQHERPFSARPERSEAKSKDTQNANFLPLPIKGERKSQVILIPLLALVLLHS
jgi:hypothetical protein